MSEYRCYVCGTEPELHEVTRFGDPEPRYVPGRYPPNDIRYAPDHHCVPHPPTPSQLEAAGDAALARILDEWAR